MVRGRRLKAPMVSVLMTAYNREKYIADAIESVLQSTFKGFELVVVDDGSTDRTVEIVEGFVRKDSRVTLHVNEKNLGDYSNRNRAALLAQGEYLKFVDADDLIYPRGLETLVDAMEKYPDAGYGLCSLEQDKFRIFPLKLSPRKAYRRHYFEQTLFHKAPLSSIIRKEAFSSVGGFTGKQHVGDFEMWHLLSAKFPVVLMPHGIVWYREHSDQQMNDNRTDPSIPFKYFLVSAELLKSEINPLSASEKKLALKQLLRRQARYILHVVVKHGPSVGIRLKRKGDLSCMSLLYYALSSP